MRATIMASCCLSLFLTFAGCGGGGGDGTASTPPPSSTPPPGGDPSTGCEAPYDAESDFFPSVLWREKIVSAPPDGDVFEIGLGSASGSCRRTLVEFPPGFDPSYPSFWSSADGSRGIVVWVRPADDARIVEAASFTVEPAGNGSYPQIQVGITQIVASIEQFRFFGILDPEVSADGTCVAYLSDPSVLADPDASDWELRIDNVSSITGADPCDRVGVLSLPRTSAAGAPGDFYDDPKWSPDSSGVFVVQSVDGASGVSRVDLETGNLQQVIEPSAVERVESIDVSLYNGQTQIALEKRNFISGDGISEDCTLIDVVDGQGNSPAEPFVPFLGLQPLWSTRGSLSQPGMPSVSYFAYSDGVACGIDLLEETDPFNLGPVVTQYDPQVLFVDDVN